MNIWKNASQSVRYKSANWSCNCLLYPLDNKHINVMQRCKIQFVLDIVGVPLKNEYRQVIVSFFQCIQQCIYVLVTKKKLKDLNVYLMWQIHVVKGWKRVHIVSAKYFSINISTNHFCSISNDRHTFRTRHSLIYMIDIQI